MSADLVPQPLAGDDGNLIADTLVRLEIEGELRVVALNDDLGRLLHGLRIISSVAVPPDILGASRSFRIVLTLVRTRPMLAVFAGLLECGGSCRRWCRNFGAGHVSRFCSDNAKQCCPVPILALGL